MAFIIVKTQNELSSLCMDVQNYRILTV